MKQVVFNVGGALSTYIEYNSKKIIIDLGQGNSFNPVKDFLLPLFQRKEVKANNRFNIDQLILSHPHNDHLSAIKDFDKYFYPNLLTCPNDNDGMKDDYKINWQLVDNPSDEYVDYLKEKMLPGRTPPLRSSNPTDLFIYYIPPKYCETHSTLELKNYTNNTSIAVYIRINNYNVFLPGDLMKDGMEYILKNESSLRRRLREGVEILIAPHHGLKSSFSQKLFDEMKNNKTRCLNIVSEKSTSEDSNRVVDSRYSSTNFCAGENNLSTVSSKICQRKTSNGHIFINYSNRNFPFIEIINDNDVLLKRFL